MSKRLSILICSLRKRKESRNDLLSVLNVQPQTDIEILVEIDEGQMSIGAKRNLLLQRAQGDYVAFVDDDDIVSLNYVNAILSAVSTSPDCCSLMGEISHRMSIRVGRKKQRQKFKHIFIHSIAYNYWFEKDGIYYRCPNHLNAIKREIALKVGFPEKNTGEDLAFSTKIYSLLKTEVQISGILYYYLAS